MYYWYCHWFTIAWNNFVLNRTKYCTMDMIWQNFGGQHSKLKTTEEWWFRNFATSSGYPRHSAQCLSPVEISIPPAEVQNSLKKIHVSRWMHCVATHLHTRVILIMTVRWQTGKPMSQQRLRLRIQYSFLFSLLRNMIAWAWNLLSMRT